ncbi:MAG TPA: hypothetical protein VLU25_15865 [Acidobacteriota bacterium]|nr:hypothetical protein [Acidobacteriota bacterium]
MTAMNRPDGQRALDIYGEAAAALGIELRLLDQDSKILGELIRGHQRRYILAGHIPLNESLSTRLADDKFYSGLLLGRHGISVPKNVRCLRPGHFTSHRFGLQEGWRHAIGFARHEGYPVVVKPNTLCGGQLVSVAEDEEQIRQALREIWHYDGLALVQQRVPGVDIRLDFLDDEFLIGYSRLPLVVQGDGRSTIRRLAERKDRRYASDLIWKEAPNFPDWKRQVLSRGWDEQTVLPRGQSLRLGGDILNLRRFALGGIITDPSRPWIEIGRRIAGILNLRHLGIDFRVPSLQAEPEEAVVVDVNPRPGLTQIYRLGHRREVLEAGKRVLTAVFG